MAKILICEDSEFMRGRIKEVLEHEGHEVVGLADGGDDAVEKYRLLRPDLVTMDIIMKSSGVDAIKRIIEMNPKAKILIVSILEGNQAEVIEGIHSGAKGCVTKPIKAEVLVDEVERVLDI